MKDYIKSIVLSVVLYSLFYAFMGYLLLPYLESAILEALGFGVPFSVLQTVNVYGIALVIAAKFTFKVLG